MTDELTTQANRFIVDHQRGPFFIEVAYNATHFPFQPPNLPPDKRARPEVLHDGTRASTPASRVLLSSHAAIAAEGGRRLTSAA